LEQLTGHWRRQKAHSSKFQCDAMVCMLLWGKNVLDLSLAVLLTPMPMILTLAGSAARDLERATDGDGSQYRCQ
jgi:hypothetical protein